MFIPIILHSCFGSDFVFLAFMVQVSLSCVCEFLPYASSSWAVGNMNVQTKEIVRSIQAT